MTSRTRTFGMAAALILVPALVVGLALFQPWRLFTHHTVNEALPVVSAVPTNADDLGKSGSIAPKTPRSSQLSTAPVTLRSGIFRSGEHRTVGAAAVILLADRSRIVRLSGFDTSDGPDVHVILSDQPAGSSDHAVDRGSYVKLGKLKGTSGNQNYPVPAMVNLASYRSVVIWCDRFNVTFGSADLS